MGGVENPLNFIDFADVVGHGDPGKWKLLGAKPGSLGTVQYLLHEMGGN